jgi:hypothetical protein
MLSSDRSKPLVLRVFICWCNLFSGFREGIDIEVIWSGEFLQS